MGNGKIVFFVASSDEHYLPNRSFSLYLMFHRASDQVALCLVCTVTYNDTSWCISSKIVSLFFGDGGTFRCIS